jgi:hypothetical protein
VAGPPPEASLPAGERGSPGDFWWPSVALSQGDRGQRKLVQAPVDSQEERGHIELRMFEPLSVSPPWVNSGASPNRAKYGRPRAVPPESRRAVSRWVGLRMARPSLSRAVRRRRASCPFRENAVDARRTHAAEASDFAREPVRPSGGCSCSLTFVGSYAKRDRPCAPRFAPHRG